MNPEKLKKPQPAPSEGTQNCKIETHIYKMMYIVLVYMGFCWLPNLLSLLLLLGFCEEIGQHFGPEVWSRFWILTNLRHYLKQLFWWKNVTFGSVVPLTMFLTIPETQTKLQMYICRYVLYSILIFINHVSVLRTRRAWLWTLLGRTLLILLRQGELNLGKWRNLGSDQTSSGRSKPRQI